MSIQPTGVYPGIDGKLYYIPFAISTEPIKPEDDLALCPSALWGWSEENIASLRKRLAALIGTEHETRARQVNHYAGEVLSLKADERYSF